MKKLALMAMTVLLLVSCATPRLYYWGSNSSLNDDTSAYEEILYNNYDKQTPESLCALVCLYEDMVAHPGGTRNVVPPGIYAEYGYLLLQPATAEAFLNHATAKQRKMFKSSDFGTFFLEHGVEMLQKEIELYPESEKFIKPLLERIKGKKS